MRNIVIDCADPYALAQFWSQVVERPMADDDEPGDPEALVQLAGGPALLFIRVPEPKQTKNRLHLCLEPDGPRDDEVERLLGLGANLEADRRNPDGTGWAVLADPEGNEFCVLRSAAEKSLSSGGHESTG